jgi:hypothetical protein
VAELRGAKFTEDTSGVHPRFFPLRGESGSLQIAFDALAEVAAWFLDGGYHPREASYSNTYLDILGKGDGPSIIGKKKAELASEGMAL